MKLSPRLFNCARCSVQVIICTDCDRGQLYCGDQCSKIARKISCCASQKRYQNTLKGRLKHAARQQRYRAKHKKVTDQGSPPIPPYDVLKPVAHETKVPVVLPEIGCSQCHFCKKPVSFMLRRRFLQQQTRYASYCGPP